MSEDNRSVPSQLKLSVVHELSGAENITSHNINNAMKRSASFYGTKRAKSALFELEEWEMPPANA